MYLIVKKSLNVISELEKKHTEAHICDKEKGKINNCQETEFFNFCF